MCLIHLDVLIVCDLKWSLFWGVLSQRRAVVILPDGTVKPAREAWLSAQHPGLHHHGHSRAEGRGDQQPRGDGGQAGWPRYRKKFFSVDRVYRYFLQIFIFASQNMIMPYMQKVSGSIPEGSTNPASGDHKPLYSQHRSWALTQICRFSLINTMYKKKKKRKLIFQETCYPILHRSSVSLRKPAPGNQVEEMFSFFVYQQQVSVNHTLWTTKACIFTFVKAHSADAIFGIFSFPSDRKWKLEFTCDNSGIVWVTFCCCNTKFTSQAKKYLVSTVSFIVSITLSDYLNVENIWSGARSNLYNTNLTLPDLRVMWE